MTIPTTGLIAHYTMDNINGSTLFDELGSYNGTVNGAVSTTGRLGNALSFNGVGDSVDLSMTLNSVTGAISLWIDGSGIFFSESQANTSNIIFYASASLITGQITLRVKDTSIGTDVEFTTDNIINQAAWNHVVIQSDGAVYSVYINGISSPLTFTKGSNTGAWTNKVTSTTGTYLGRAVLSNTSYFYTGAIDQCRIYDQALTAAEVQALLLETISGYQVLGVVSLDGIPHAGELRLYDVTTGTLVDTAISDVNGEYRVDLDTNATLYVMAVPPPGYRPLMHGPITPTERT